MLVDTVRTALPSIGRVEVAFPETDFTVPMVVVQTTFGFQREVGIGQDWSTGEKANYYDISAQIDVYGNDTLDCDSIIDDVTDYFATNRSGMQAWTSILTGESPSMIDITLTGTGDFGNVPEIDAWRKTLTYMVQVVKPQ